MSRSLTIIDADYKNWVKELSQRYRRSQIKAAVKVNNEVLKFWRHKSSATCWKFVLGSLGSPSFLDWQVQQWCNQGILLCKANSGKRMEPCNAGEFLRHQSVWERAVILHKKWPETHITLDSPSWPRSITKRSSKRHYWIISPSSFWHLVMSGGVKEAYFRWA